MGLAGGQLAGTENTETIRAMLVELQSFPDLTKQEKFNLVNLPEVQINDETRSTPQSATLCDICLAVPGVRDWTDQAEVSRLCEVVYQFKRV